VADRSAEVESVQKFYSYPVNLITVQPKRYVPRFGTEPAEIGSCVTVKQWTNTLVRL
jgi:hypothetical protein